MFWYWLLDNGATLLVGILGFSGVIVTLLVNARNTRNQHSEGLRQQRQALRAALIEELKIRHTALEQNIEKPAAGKGFLVPTGLLDDAYRAFIDRVGLLSQPEVAAVMKAYLTVRQHFSNLALLGEVVGEHIQIPPDNTDTVIGMAKNLITPVDEAIQAMETARTADGQSPTEAPPENTPEEDAAVETPA